MNWIEERAEGRTKEKADKGEGMEKKMNELKARAEDKKEEETEGRGEDRNPAKSSQPVMEPEQGEIIMDCGARQIRRWRFDRAEIQEYELKMLQYCEIKGLQKPVIHWQGEEALLDFDLTAAESGERQTANQAEQYVRQLMELERILPEYLLTTEGLQIGAGAATYFPESGEWRFCYLPLKVKEGLQDLDFFRGLFQKQARLFLQMEMMRENRELRLRDYLAAVRQAGW